MVHSRVAKKMWLFTACLTVALTATGCDGERDGDGDTAPVAVLALPLEVAEPSDNPSSPAKVELGRLLFWDPVLSGDRTTACATCHHPDFGYADGRALSVGVGGAGLGPGRRPSGPPHVTNRNAPTVLNTAFNGLTRGGTTEPTAAPMFWDSRAKSLERQARGPLVALHEMRGPGLDEAQVFPELVSRLQQIPEYVTRFQASFGDEPISEQSILRAIAAFERTLVSRGSSYDRYQRGEAGALSASAQRGIAAFNRSGCDHCHSGPMFSDYALHRLGAPDVPGAAADQGGGGRAFRTPSLRNVTRTAPYMHSGAFATLDQVFNFYDRVDRRLDPQLNDVRGPDRGDAADVKALLAALSDGTFDQRVPTEVPSGLPPGGALR
jgi:cytochrome c peroxidase